MRMMTLLGFGLCYSEHYSPNIQFLMKSFRCPRSHSFIHKISNVGMWFTGFNWLYYENIFLRLMLFLQYSIVSAFLSFLFNSDEVCQNVKTHKYDYPKSLVEDGSWTRDFFSKMVVRSIFCCECLYSFLVEHFPVGFSSVKCVHLSILQLVIYLYVYGDDSLTDRQERIFMCFKIKYTQLYSGCFFCFFKV